MLLCLIFKFNQSYNIDTEYLCTITVSYIRLVFDMNPKRSAVKVGIRLCSVTGRYFSMCIMFIYITVVGRCVS
jgi:hypothetical protein